ncbi:nucleotide exchange factor GrpE [Alphaproteobacteria bacterium]|nr:nucleotide exchange factor GrpE [Alphaproteobacteria bacterium]
MTTLKMPEQENTPESMTEEEGAEIFENPQAVESDPQDIDDAAEKLGKELKETKDHLLRSLADLENLRKRTEKELSDARKYAVSAFARDVLSIADNLNRALAATGDVGETEDSLQQLVEGVTLTQKELQRVLKTHGVEEVETDGKTFDSHLHQAMMEVDSEQAPGTIVQCLQTGYTLKDRLLRPAMVTVARKPSSDNKET